MVHYKKLFSLDPECLEILKEEPTKKQSDFVRQAIKHFNANRTKKEEPKSNQISIEDTPAQNGKG